MLPKSYYLILGVSRSETTRGIREAFVNLIKRYNPDRLGAARAYFFQEILDAYHVLADPERRRHYDRGLDDAVAEADRSPAAILMGSDNPNNLLQPLAIFRNFTIKDVVFQAALARISERLTSAQPPTQESPTPLITRVILSTDEAARGGVLSLDLPTCSPCESCGGSGREGMFSCSWCDGEGLIEEQETVAVQFGPMIGDGARIDVPLRGLGIHNFYLQVDIRVAANTKECGLL
jgi:DnaJ-class molecular chaperone